VKPPYAAAAAVLILSGCGYIGEPMYPLLNIPAPVTGLTAIERGAVIVYEFTLPVRTTEGKLVKIARTEIRIGEAPVGSFNRESWLAKAIELQAKPDEHGRVKSEFPVAPWVGKELILGVRVYAVNGKDGEWSLVPISAVTPLAKPAAVSVTTIAEGVRVSWQGAAAQYRVFRRAGQETAFAPVATVEADQWLDTSTEFGKPYQYVVQATQKTGNRDAESERSEPTKELTPADIFPPAVPAGLNAITATENIELVWDRNTEPDLAGYRLYRAAGDGGLEKLADIQDTPSYSDRKVESGKRYRYAISAVDRLGNESKQSEAVEVVAP
jgi:hypothetical protein